MAVAEKLIQSVSGYPVLYNASLHDYRSSERRVNAWREVAACVGLSGQCVNITRARHAFDFEKCFCSVDLDDFTHIFTAGDATNYNASVSITLRVIRGLLKARFDLTRR